MGNPFENEKVSASWWILIKNVEFPTEGELTHTIHYNLDVKRIWFFSPLLWRAYSSSYEQRFNRWKTGVYFQCLNARKDIFPNSFTFILTIIVQMCNKRKTGKLQFWPSYPAQANLSFIKLPGFKKHFRNVNNKPFCEATPEPYLFFKAAPILSTVQLWLDNLFLSTSEIFVQLSQWQWKWSSVQSVFVDPKYPNSMKLRQLGEEDAEEGARVDQEMCGIIFCVETCKNIPAKRERLSVFYWISARAQEPKARRASR